MMTAAPFDIKITGNYFSITDMEWKNIPMLAIITGKNGVGKSQLLGALKLWFNAKDIDDPQNTNDASRYPFKIDTPFERLDIKAFFRNHDWLHTTSTKCNRQHIEQLLNHIFIDRVNPIGCVSRFASRWGVEPNLLNTKDLSVLAGYLDPIDFFIHQSFSRMDIGSIFLWYLLIQEQAKQGDAQAQKNLAQCNGAPWDKLNFLLREAKLNFTFLEPKLPTLNITNMFHAELTLCTVEIQRADATIVPIESMSSGEKVMLGIVLWRYELEEKARLGINARYNLLLLDEPDAHLHPSLAKVFIDTMNEVFCKQGIRVIMTTHSPTTVAMAPKGSVFEMREQGETPRIELCTNKDEAIANLSDGLVIVSKWSKIVLLEGTSDPRFYQASYNLLRDANLLPVVPSLIFCAAGTSAGNNKVRDLVDQFYKEKIPNFYGICDRDQLNDTQISHKMKSLPTVFYTQRQTLEYYLFDPLNVKAFIEEFKNLDDQDVINKCAQIISKKQNNELMGSPINIKYTDGTSLDYPECLLRSNEKGHQIKKHYTATFEQLKNLKKDTDSKLWDEFEKQKKIPLEILDMFTAIIGDKTNTDEGSSQ